MTTKFRNPPINEVVIGIYFDRDLAPLRSEHVGVFWSTVRDEFPVIRQQQAIARPAFGPILASITFEFPGENELYPMPRFWLESADGVTLMQIQKNAFIFNWRKRNGAYPHYEFVKNAFDINFARFSRFLQSELSVIPSPQIAELNYVNLIESGDYWKGPQDTADVVPNFRLPMPLRPELPPPDFNQVTVERFAADLSVTTSIKSGRSAPPELRPSLILEFRAIGLTPAATKSEVDPWYDRAHKIIGDCFTSITSQDVQQRYWQPE
jgi:uncharacterized protein (TIGR04255 family)